MSSSNSSLFISTIPAKQMARELEITAAIMNELYRLLDEERQRNEALQARNDILSAELTWAKTRARTERRKRQRKAAKLRGQVSELTTRLVEAERYGLEMSHVVQEEKERADDFADDYANVLRRYQFRREECDILRARCEQREDEIAEMRAHARRVADDFAAERDELFIKHATREQLMDIMQAIPPGEQLLPVRPLLNPEEDSDAAARDRELNTMKLTNPIKFFFSGEKYIREFLGRWRWYHKRLPGGAVSGEAIPGWGGEGAGEELEDGEVNDAAGVYDCHCCCDNDNERDE